MMSPCNDDDGFAIDREVEGLSPLARAAYAMIVALIYETQQPEVPVARIVRGAGISLEQWPAIQAELYDQGVAYPYSPDISIPAQPPTMMGANSGGQRLSVAMGASGRAGPREWAELRQAVFQRHGRVCIYCPSEDDIEVDHLLSVRRGGSNHIENLVPACKSCNSAKGAKSWPEWAQLMLAQRRGD